MNRPDIKMTSFYPDKKDIKFNVKRKKKKKFNLTPSQEHPNIKMTKFPKKIKFNVKQNEPNTLQTLALDSMTQALHQSIQYELNVKQDEPTLSKKEIAQARGYYMMGDDRSWFAPHPASIGNLKGKQRKKAEKALHNRKRRGIGDMTINI